MSIQFKTLFTLTISHDYYEAACQDFEYLIPDETQKLLRNGRIICRVIDGVLHCLYETDDSGDPLVSLSNNPEQRLVFGLKLLNPHFKNFSSAFSNSLGERELDKKIAYYRNSTAAETMNSAIRLTMAGSIISHDISDATRPVTIQLLNESDVVLQENIIDDINDRTHINYGLNNISGAGKLPDGRYRINEGSAFGEIDTEYYSHAELNFNGVFGVAEVGIEPGLYSAPVNFEISFTSQQETLKYYVVAKNYSNAEFGSLTITDIGFGEDSRPEISFTKVLAASFSDSDIAPGLLGNGEDKIAVFRSRSLVERREKARRKIQLSRNGDVLISHLPAPASKDAQSDLVIHVAKP